MGPEEQSKRANNITTKWIDDAASVFSRTSLSIGELAEKAMALPPLHLLVRFVSHRSQTSTRSSSVNLATTTSPIKDNSHRQGVAFTPRDHMRNSFGLLARCRLGAPSVASLHSYRVTKRNRLPCFCSLAHAGAWTRRRPRSEARAPLMTTVRFVK